MDFAEELDCQLYDHLQQLRDDPEYRKIYEESGTLTSLERSVLTDPKPHWESI